MVFLFLFHCHGADAFLPSCLLPLLNHYTRRSPGAVIRNMHSAYRTTFLMHHCPLGFIMDLIAEFIAACSVRICVSLQYNDLLLDTNFMKDRAKDKKSP